MKTCTKCLIEKNESEFHKDKTKSDGLYSQCKSCKILLTNNYRENNKEYFKEQRKPNSKKYRELHKDSIKLKREKNKDYFKKYAQNNKEKINKYLREYNNRKKINTEFKIKQTLRSRMLSAVRQQSGTKAHKSMELLGCSIDEVRLHLESLFQEGMSWENHGEWHIDHIIPCTSFDLTNPEQQKLCFNWTNLQPLWAKENISKGNRKII